MPCREVAESFKYGEQKSVYAEGDGLHRHCGCDADLGGHRHLLSVHRWSAKNRRGVLLGQQVHERCAPGHSPNGVLRLGDRDTGHQRRDLRTRHPTRRPLRRRVPGNLRRLLLLPAGLLRAQHHERLRERRFGLAARLTTSVANFIQLTLYTGVVLYAPSLAIEATTGLSSKASILLIAVICIFYSTIGGIKAVLVTDIFQGVLMFASLICIMAVASSEIEGGLSNVWHLAQEGGRIEFFDFRPDPTIRHTFWCLLSGGFCLFCSLYGVNQVEVQRLLTVKSLRAARLALFLNLPLLVSFGLLTSFCGLVLYAVYKDCDPVATGEIASPDRIMPHFAATKMSIYPGLTGLFISGIFSASLSTISAMLNALSAVFLEDYLKRIYIKMGKTFPIERATVFGKILAIVNGCISVTIALLAGSLGSLVHLTVTITGSICGPVLGIFTLGMFFESSNERGAIVGITTALVMCMWASFGQPRPKIESFSGVTDGCNFTVLPATPSFVKEYRDPSTYFYLYRISYMWYSGIGLAITVVVGYIASLAFARFSPGLPIEPDPSLFTPLIARRIRRRRADAARTTSSQVFTLEDARKPGRDK